jgi:type I restriction enzyme S subunit
MADLDAESGTTTRGISRPYGEVAKGYTQFANHDILIAKITPCFENGKICQAELQSELGVGSTEFHVVRPNRSKVDDKFLLSYLRQPWIRWAGEQRMTGSGGQRRVPISFLADLPIPLPTLEEQRKIAHTLGKTEELRNKKKKVISLLSELIQSHFLDMFGDPSSNPLGWPELPMSDLLAEKPNYGTMLPASKEKKGWLCLRVANIQDWNLDLSDRKYIELEGPSAVRHSVAPGDLLLARAIASESHLGKAVVAYPGDEKWAFDSHLMRLRLDEQKAEPHYVRAFLKSPGGRKRFMRVTRRSAVQFNINTKEMGNLRIPVPPIEHQRKFRAAVAAIEKLRQTHQSHAKELDALFASLQHRAFRGELWPEAPAA